MCTINGVTFRGPPCTYMYTYTYTHADINVFKIYLTLTLLTWTIWRAPTNASKWRMGFNSAFKGLRTDRIEENHFAAHFK